MDLSQLNLYICSGTFKMETPETIRLSVQKGEWVTSLDFSRRLLSHPNTTKVKEVPALLSKGADFSVHCPPFWFGHSSTGVHKGGQRGETHSTSTGYPDPPVPRQLVTESPVSGNLPTTYPDPVGPWPRIRVGSKHEIRVDPSTSFQFRRLPVRPSDRSSPAHSGKMERCAGKVTFYQGQENLPRQFMSLIGLLTAKEKQVWSGRLHRRPIHWHLKQYWHVPEVLEKIIPVPRSLCPHLY